VLVSVLVFAGLLVWQFSSSPSLQRSTQAQRALPIAEQVISEHSDVRLVEANFRFTRPPGSSGEKEALLGVVYVEKVGETAVTNDFLQQQLEEDIQQNLLAQGFHVKPLITVTVLEPPPAAPAGN
jgi:uncharacterized membrane protein